MKKKLKNSLMLKFKKYIKKWLKQNNKKILKFYKKLKNIK